MMRDKDDQCKVVCFLQFNFIDFFRDKEVVKKWFFVIVFDDCDIIYVCVESNNKDELEK